MKTSGSREPGGFAESLRAAIEARGVSLVWLRDRLAELGSPVSLTTLSYWRTGRRHPEGASSLAAIAAIEELLHVPPAHLTSALAPSRRTGPLPSPEVPLDDAVRAATEETLQALAAAPLSAIRDVSTQVVADVDEHGHIHRRETRILVQATSGTVRELPWVEVAAVPTTSVPVFSQVVGAQVVRTHRHPSGLVNGFVFELERPLTAPDAAIFEWVADIDEDYPHESNVAHFVTRPARETVIWVRFHPEALPTWCEETTGDDEPRSIAVAPGHTVHAVRSRFGPGVLMVRWGFDERPSS